MYICDARMIYMSIMMIYDVLMDLCVFKCVTCFLLMSFHDIINSRFVSRRSKAHRVFVVSLPYSCEPPSISSERSPAFAATSRSLQAGGVSEVRRCAVGPIGSVAGEKIPSGKVT